MITTLRKKIKRLLYGYVPGFTGSFPYYGVKVYFPKGSLIFELACEQVTYESDNLRVILKLVKPNTTYFDIGSNIGLMSVPVLQKCASCTAVSFEPSPNTFPSLKKTAKASGFGERWKVVRKGVSNTIGNLEFFSAQASLGAYDGLQDTHRAGKTVKVTVPVTTVDAEWDVLGKPEVSFIKIDVEGGELQVLQGASQCIAQNRPHILTEWNADNLKAYNCDPKNLIVISEEINYQIFSLPHLIPVYDERMLTLQMITGENFLLSPK